MSDGLYDSGDVRPIPDPTRETTRQTILGLDNLEKLTGALQAGDVRVIEMNIAALRRERDIAETHRLELKTDANQHRLELKAGDERALSAAMIAADKAVVAALAASEKARDQQTIASQLATSKAEAASAEQLRQQKETFTLSISSLTDGFNDLKGLMGEQRAKERATADTTVDRRASSSLIIAATSVGVVLLVGILGALVTVIVKLSGN